MSLIRDDASDAGLTAEGHVNHLAAHVVVLRAAQVRVPPSSDPSVAFL